MLGVTVEPLQGGAPSSDAEGWNESERSALRAIIAARQPFLDFALGRVRKDGSTQRFRVSGEPMFSQNCRFIGYRGIGVEVAL
jgi:PAS domain-containing protein